MLASAPVLEREQAEAAEQPRRVPASTSRTRRPPHGAPTAARLSRWKPVAITVIFTSSFMRFVHDHAEVDLRVFVRRGAADQRAGFVDVVQAQLAGAGDVDQHAARALHAAFFHQRRTDGLARGFDGRVLAVADAVPIMA